MWIIKEISHLRLLVVALWYLVVGDVNKTHLCFFHSELRIKDLEDNERCLERQLVRNKKIPASIKDVGMLQLRCDTIRFLHLSTLKATITMN